MKRRIWGILMLFAALTAIPSLTQANLGDTRDVIRSHYGEYRMVYGSFSQLYTREDWEAKGRGLREGTYRHLFSRLDVPITLDVDYNSRQADATVLQQRFMLGKAIALKDFKKYFPEICQSLNGPEVKIFSAREKPTTLLSDEASPVVLLAVTKQFPSGEKKDSYMLLVFNILDEGRLIKETKYVDQDTQITEFTIEQTNRYQITDAFNNKGKWKVMPNYFQ